jgi:transcriptional regulator with XRE-family HTH domain
MQHGSHQLKQWLERARLDQRQGAAKLGMHFTTLNKILLRKRVPTLKSAIRIERLTGVPMEAWAAPVVGKSKKRAQPEGEIGPDRQGVNA